MGFQKKQWEFNDIITEGELNRIENGIEEAITSAEQAQQTAQQVTEMADQANQTASQAASAASSVASDLAAHLAESASETKAGHIQLATTAETTEGTNTTKAVTPAGVKAVGDSKAPLRYTSITITDSTTLALTHANKRILCDSSSDITITVPPNSSVPFSAGDEIEFIAYGAGTVTFVAGSGVTIRSKDGSLSIDGQYACASLLKINTDEWLLIGALG